MRSQWLAVAVTCLALWLCTDALVQAAEPEPIVSGPAPGTLIQSFFVRAVTGPHRNRSVCYVCRYGSRPVVMVLVQDVDPNIPKLLKAIDGIVDENRVAGLRSFGVLVTDESSSVVPILQTMAFDEQIRTPLTASTTAIAGSGASNLHREAATTVVLYRRQKAVQSLAFERGRLDGDAIKQVLDSIDRLLETETGSSQVAR